MGIRQKYFCEYSKPLKLMSAIILLLFASISVAALFLGAFIWSVRSGQYDDDVSPPLRMLFDNRPKEREQDTTAKKQPS
jgi:cbb3-type cytochrome oxidase maturation protein